MRAEIARLNAEVLSFKSELALLQQARAAQHARAGSLTVGRRLSCAIQTGVPAQHGVILALRMC